MTLLNQSVQVSGQLGKLFGSLRDGQAPTNFTRAFLKDLGYKSSNHHAVIPLLKGLGFLTADGAPTPRYKEFLDETRWRKVLAEAIREAYEDIFVIRSKPTKDDRKAIAGKYKSTYNLSDTAAERAASTFLALLDLADPNALYASSQDGVASPPNGASSNGHAEGQQPLAVSLKTAARELGLHNNIQIHLPATKDLEVYSAIFKSLREHLVV
jgi:hypothetical protein